MHGVLAYVGRTLFVYVPTGSHYVIPGNAARVAFALYVLIQSPYL